MTTPDPLPLRNIPVLPEVSAVAGCDCGGLDWHRAEAFGQPGCSIWALPPEEQRAAIDAAHARLDAFTESLNAGLRAALGDQ